MIEVKYSPESLADLQRVVEFVEVKNLYAARRIAIDLQEGVSKLKQFPQIGLPVIKAPDPEKIRDLYVNDYTVRYLTTDETIYILRVWHNKENEKNLQQAQVVSLVFRCAPNLPQMRALCKESGSKVVSRKLISSGSEFEKEIGYSRAILDGDYIFVSGTTATTIII